MKVSQYIRSRVRRGFYLRTLGPNEARLLYDAVVAIVGAAAAAIFSNAFIAAIPVGWKAVIPPIALIALNAALGIYSRLKRATGTRKAVVLTASVTGACATALALGVPAEFSVLWALLVWTPVTIARVILHLGNSRNREIAAVAVNVRGPVLVIGGAGYIGTHAVEQLLRNGYSVRVLDNLMYGDDSLSEFRNHPQFELLQGDATDIRKLTLAMRDASAVIHLAGLVGDPACAVAPEFTRHTNIVATRMAKDVAQALGVHKFIFASSCSVYGVSDEEVDEFAKLSPVSLYAQTKIDSEQELLSSSSDDFFVTILRFATVFGHSRRPRFDLVANLFTAQAVTDGRITVIGPQQWRPFIHVRDLGRAIVMVLKADPMTVQSQVFNVGDTRLNMTILQLAEVVRKVVGETRTVEISVTDNAADRRNYAVSFKKIRDVLGFSAETLMEDGVREMLEHFHNGDYAHYRSLAYSNVAMTAKALNDFQDPAQMAHLYAPLSMEAK
jgi:nucleoside-diphosphate-sugar epimerase